MGKKEVITNNKKLGFDFLKLSDCYLESNVADVSNVSNVSNVSDCEIPVIEANDIKVQKMPSGKKNMCVTYPVKIHLAGCTCPYYQKKSTSNKEIIVAPYKMEEYKKRYYIYESETQLKKDINIFEDQCLCTYNKTLSLNGGIALLSKFGNCDMKFIDSEEMINFNFYKIVTTKNLSDNSKLINEMYNYIASISSDYLEWRILIGKTIDTTNFSIPKGKIKYGETSEECAYREFREETGIGLDDELISPRKQMIQRELYDINLPLEIVINNFLIKIIII